jgi:pimeloyl-ACP methyl ester carboxylesterase
MKTYQIQSHQCQLQVYASIKQDSNPVLLFLHGGPGSGASPIFNLPAFTALHANISAVHFDQRGSGNSTYDIKNGLTIEDITNDVLCVATFIKQQWQTKDIFLVGGSFGGYLACLCMQRFPSVFSGLVLSSPAITFGREQALNFYNNAINLYTTRFNDSSWHLLTSHIHTSPEDFFNNQQVRDFIFSKANPTQSLKHICAMSDWFFKQDFTSLFSSLTLPILILQGQEDPICSSNTLSTFIEEIDNKSIQYIVYEHCGHAVFEDKADAFEKEIYYFVKEICI